MDLIFLLVFYWCLYQPAEGLTLSKNLIGKEFNLQGKLSNCECKNGGTCLYDANLPGPRGSSQRVSTGTCYCDQVSKGIFAVSRRTCRKLKDLCTPNPCVRGGRCINKMGYFFCVDCDSGWSGQDCTRRRTVRKQWTEDFTIVWYPNSDFQVTSISWLRLSFAQAGTQPLVIYLEYFGILIRMWEPFHDQKVTPSLKDCYAMQSENVACNTHRKGIDYHTLVLKAQTNFLAAPYNLIFGANLENALTISHPRWPYRMYAVNYEVKLHVYSNYEPLMPVKPLNIWHQVTSTYSACLPLISFDGCDTSAKYPRKWLSHELVSIQLISRHQDNNICKNLVVELRDAVTFYENNPNDESDIAKRPIKNIVTLTKIEWQDNAELTFVQQKRYFFGFNSFWIATFPLKLYGSYVSTAGRDLFMELNAMCFIHIEPPITSVTVEGGDRTVDCMEPVEFQPLSSNPAFDLDLFTLKWSCIDDSDPANPVCQVQTTKWGPYKYDKLNCDRIFKFKMEPSHEYSKSSSPNDVGKAYTWTITTEVGSTEIKVLCRKKCDAVNPANEVLLEAVETPLSGSGPPEWAIYEGGTTGTKLPLSDYRRSIGDPWFISIKRDSLKVGTKYAVEARTTKGRGSREFETNSPPVKGNCRISPESGIKGVTEFTVTCKDWEDEHTTILYTFGINLNNLFEPLIESFYGDNLPPTVLFYENISVCVSDIYNLETIYPLTVKLTDNDLAYNLTKELRVFTEDYLHRDYVRMMKWVVKNSKASFADPNFPPSWKVEIFKNTLKTIPHVKYYYSIDQMVGSMLRLMKGTEEGKITYDANGVQDMMLGVGEGLELAAEQFREQCSLEEGWYTMWDFHIYGIISVIMTTADAAFKAHDPILLPSSKAGDGTQEIHRQKAKYGVWYVLRSLQTVLDIARSIMVTDQRPYILSKGGITIFTAVGRAKTLQGYLKEFERHGSTVILSSNVVNRLGISIYAVEVIRIDSYAYHAWKPVVGQVLQIKFLRGPPGSIRAEGTEFEEIEMSKGPYRLVIDMGSNLTSRDIKGEVVLPAWNTTHFNRYVSLNHFKLPTGYGGVIVNIEGKHFGKIKMKIAHGERPSYFDINRTSPVNKYRHEVKFHNNDTVFNANFYIGVISNGLAVYHYEAKVTIVRCVIYISDEWEAQKCKYKSLRENNGKIKVACDCYHLSQISSDLVAPENSIAFEDDIFLFTTIWDNFYVATVMLFILVAYFGLLIWGKCNDAKDHRTRSITFLPDNYPGEIHPYIVVVWTGKRCKAGTSSKVAIRIIGTAARSRPHIFRSPYRMVLGIASDDWFLMYTAKYLGEIKEIVLWHNSTGCAPDWYCNQITVYDLKTKIPYNFVVDRWFAVIEDLDESKLWRGKLSKKGSWITEPEDNIAKLVGDHFFAGVREKHRWTSIFTRHPRSTYTRCERIAVLGTMLICTMLTSIMFFGAGDFGAADLPFAYMSVDDIVVSLKSMLIGSILSFLTLYAFNKSKRKPKEERTVTQKEIIQEAKMKDKLSKVKMDWMMKLYVRAKNNLPITYLPILDEKTLKEQIRQEKFNYWLMTAWIVSTIFLVAISFVVVLYGLRFGKKRSLLWIQAFISGTLFDAFFLEPFKMVLFAFLTAIVFKRSSIGDVKVEVEYDQKELPFKDYLLRLNMMWRRTRSEYKPMSYARMKRIYQHRQRMDIVRRYLLYMVILTLMAACAVVLVVTFNTKSRYFSNLQLQEHLTSFNAKYVVNAENIHNVAELTNYTIDTLLASIHRTKWYNGQLLKPERAEPRGRNLTKVESQRKGWCIDYNSKLLGVPRIRQQRLSLKKFSTKVVSDYFKKFKKDPAMSRYFSFPLGHLNLLDEDYNTYLIGWEPYDKRKHGNVTKLWKHVQIHNTQTDIYRGETGQNYPGHGYVELLYWSRGESEKRYNALIMNNWLDNRTRVLFAEVNLYNINLNMFTSFVLLCERLPSNIYVVKPLIDTAILLIQGDAFETISLMATLILIGILAVYASYWIIESSRVGLLTAALTWRGFTDFACILVGIIQVCFNIAKAIRLSAFPDVLDRKARDEFIPLYAPFYNSFKVQLCLGVFCLLVMSAFATSVHNLIGYRRFRWVLSNIIYITGAVVFINFFINVLIGSMMKTEGVINTRYLFFDIILRETPQRELINMTWPIQGLLVVCFPICYLLMRTILATVIYYHLVAERLGPLKTGIAVETFGRKYAMNLKDPTHELHAKNVLSRLQSINKNINMLQMKMDKKRQMRLKAEEKARKKEEKLAKKEAKKMEKNEKGKEQMESKMNKEDEKEDKERLKKDEKENKAKETAEAAEAKKAAKRGPGEGGAPPSRETRSEGVSPPRGGGVPPPGSGGVPPPGRGGVPPRRRERPPRR